MGVDIPMKYKDDPAGPAEAHNFLEKNKVESNAEVPATFWQEFENMKAGTAIHQVAQAASRPHVQASIAAALPQCGPPVKAELSTGSCKGQDSVKRSGSDALSSTAAPGAQLKRRRKA